MLRIIRTAACVSCGVHACTSITVRSKRKSSRDLLERALVANGSRLKGFDKEQPPRGYLATTHVVELRAADRIVERNAIDEGASRPRGGLSWRLAQTWRSSGSFGMMYGMRFEQ